LEYLAFDEARNFVRKLGLKSSQEWNEYCKSGKKPANIPRSVPRTYKIQWNGWGDWLGTATLREKRFRAFEEARSFVRLLELENVADWERYSKSGQQPPDIPANPKSVYRKDWTGFGDWLGTGRIADQYKVYRDFLSAREFVHVLKLANRNEWTEYCKSGRKPADIPATPDRTYRKAWKGMRDWLGSHGKSNKKMEFDEARKYVHLLRLKNTADWKNYCKSGKKPSNIPAKPDGVYLNRWKGMTDWLGTTPLKYRSFEDARRFLHTLGLRNTNDWYKYRKSQERLKDIPSTPEQVYKREWKGIGDWLGTNTVANVNRKYRSFEDAVKFVRNLHLDSQTGWRNYLKSGSKPDDIPTHPDRVYKTDWKGFGDWLGTLRVANQDKIYRTFIDARTFVHGLGLKSRGEWAEYCKSEQKPENIPSHAPQTYKTEWKGWGDWLGTGTIASYNREFLPFERAKEFVHSLGLKDRDDWRRYCKSGNLPVNIPAVPTNTYSSQWLGMWNWLGYEESGWTVRKVKTLLRDLIESNIIYGWDEAVLYSLLLRKGLLNLNNRHNKFFKNLIGAYKSEQGKKAINEYAYSDSENPPELSGIGEGLSAVTQENDEIEVASADYLARLSDSDPLDYGHQQSVEQILQNTTVLESINVDEEAIQFYLNYSIDKVWKKAFESLESEHETLKKVRLEGKNGNKYHDEVVGTFLGDYEGSRQIKLPNDYHFPRKPTLMQLYVAYKVKNLPYFGNFSATGAGKTLSAIIASRIIDSKLTVIVCPNDVVEQWKRNILESFSKSDVITGKEAFYHKYSGGEHQYLILNYDKFSQEDSPNLVLTLVKNKIDFIILDEVHFTKIRDEEQISKRRTTLDGLMTLARKKNPHIKVLGLSATPVVNNLREGKSLLELLSGKVYDDVATRPTVPNAVTLFEKLSTISIRELPKYFVDVKTTTIDVVAHRPKEISISHLKSNPLAIEKLLTDARIPEIVKQISGQTIIYTEYVEDIIQNISDAVEQAGYKYALFTGSDRSGRNKFLDKKVQVLIASRPLSVGVDGLQRICSRLIINTLPWTNAQYQQLLGRLVRRGHIRDVVNVYVIRATIDGYPYDELKWKRIEFKKTLADCAVDGTLPEKNLVTPQQATMEAVKWLERLERGEISTVVRRDLNVELAPVQVKKRLAKYGDFAKLNNRINNENSETTHRRMANDTTEWEEYHRQYREARKNWAIVPYEEIIKRIKQLSPRLMIGDFGCGEAQILEEFGDKRVYSFDHIAINDKATACDMKSTGLPDEAIDIAIFSLSLMGRNWQDYIAEAKRCLATGGYLLIADTTKTVKGRLSTLREMVKKQGFEIYSDEERGDFTFIEAREL
jgi:superfamily II DNA or RNA helicase